jgi:hypothetical protein
MYKQLNSELWGLRSSSLLKIHIPLVQYQGFAVLLLKNLLKDVIIHLAICHLLVTITPGPPRIILAEDLVVLSNEGRVACDLILDRDVVRWQIGRNVALLLA